MPRKLSLRGPRDVRLSSYEEAPLAPVDLYPLRRNLAQRYGADRTLDPQASDVGYEIKATSPYHGVDVAIELSGSYAALHQAIRCVRMGGTVVAGGFY
jgi:threonine dehydrogenase-like Zn-dependent dehydrogenase